MTKQNKTKHRWAKQASKGEIFHKKTKRKRRRRRRRSRNLLFHSKELTNLPDLLPTFNGQLNHQTPKKGTTDVSFGSLCGCTRVWVWVCGGKGKGFHFSFFLFLPF